MWADGGTPHGPFCGLLRRAKRVCAFCVLPFRSTNGAWGLGLPGQGGSSVPTSAIPRLRRCAAPLGMTCSQAPAAISYDASRAAWS